MSNVTSLELSKELYAVSGWDSSIAGGNARWCEIAPDQWEYLRLNDATAYEPSFKNEWFAGIPAYELGYLLRKLPRKIDDVDGQILFLSIFPSPTNSTQWEANYGGIDYKAVLPYQAYADTPENAIAKLCIELFKQNILTREKE